MVYAITWDVTSIFRALQVFGLPSEDQLTTVVSKAKQSSFVLSVDLLA